MPEPTGNEPDYLPDGSINIHGRLAKKFHFGISPQGDYRGIDNSPVRVMTSPLEMFLQINEDIDNVRKNG